LKTIIFYKDNIEKIRLENITAADSFFLKLAGLIFRKKLGEGEGLLLYNCNSIHTFWMRYPIDAIFLNRSFEIVRIIENLKPFRFSPFIRDAEFALEIMKFSAGKFNLKAGDAAKLVQN
jgi:uncharacterized protein